MQSMVVATMTQQAQAAGSSAQAGEGGGSVAPASGFAALLAAQLLGGENGTQVQMPNGVALADGLDAGQGKAKEILPEDPTDPGLAAILVPPVVVLGGGLQVLSNGKSDSAAAASTTSAVGATSASQLLALQNLAETEPVVAQARADGSVGVPSPSLSSGVPPDADMAAVRDGGAKIGSGAVAEFAVSGKGLPLVAVAKGDESRAASSLLGDMPRVPETPPGGISQPTMAPPQVAPGSSTDGASATLQPVAGSAGWSDAFGQKVVWMAGQQQQVAELHVNPPHLGPMEVRLTINNDQVSAVFVSHQPAVREAIEAAMPRLREMFADSGMTLGNAMVSSDSLPQHQFNGREGQSSGTSQRFDSSPMQDDSPQAAVRGVLSFRSDGRGAVDLFA